ncbi:MAG: hypothetical protein AAGJ35_00145 [Myxococcota bacterium]
MLENIWMTHGLEHTIPGKNMSGMPPPTITIPPANQVLTMLGLPKLEHGPYELPFHTLHPQVQDVLHNIAQRKHDPLKLDTPSHLFTCLLQLFLGTLCFGFAGLFFTQGIQILSVPERILMNLGLGVSFTLGIWSLVLLLRRLWRQIRSSLGTFAYPVPFSLLVVEWDRVRFYPYLHFTPEKSRIVHHQVEGNYTRSQLELSFAQAGTLDFSIRGRQQAEQFFDTLLQYQETLWQHLQMRQLKQILGPDWIRSAKTKPFKRDPFLFRALLCAALLGVGVALFSIPTQIYWEQKLFWQRVQQNHQYDTYLKRYPNGRYRKQCQQAKQRHLYQQAKRSQSIFAYQNYLREYPTGRFVPEAKNATRILAQDAVRRIQSKTQNPSALGQRFKLLLKRIERGGSSIIAVHFRRKSSFLKEAELSKSMRKQLIHSFVRKKDQKQLRYRGVVRPASFLPTFTTESRKEQEDLVLRALSKQLAKITRKKVFAWKRAHSKRMSRHAAATLEVSIDITKQYYSHNDIQTLAKTYKHIQKLLKWMEQHNIKRIPRIYVQTTQTSATSPSRRVAIRILYGLQFHWSLRFSVPGRKILRIKMTTGTLKQLRLRGRGSETAYGTYSRIARNAIRQFAMIFEQILLGALRYKPKSLGPQRPRKRTRHRNPPTKRKRRGFRFPKPTGVRVIDRFVQRLPPSIRKRLMNTPHKRRIQKVQTLWVTLDQLYRQLPLRKQSRYRRLSKQTRRLKLIPLLRRTMRKRASQRDPFRSLLPTP